MTSQAETGHDMEDDSAGAETEPIAVACWLSPTRDTTTALPELLRGLPAAARLAVGLADEQQSATLGHASARAEQGGSPAQAFPVPPGATLAHVANQAATLWPDADLVLVFPGAVLSAPWLEPLQRVVTAESPVATVSALDGPAAGRPGTQSQSAPVHPRLAAALPTCVYVARPAFDLVGPFDETLHSSYAALLDFSLSARERGLANLLADDVMVPTPKPELPDEDVAALRARHPMVLGTLDQPPGPAVERSLMVAKVAAERLEVTVDARALGPHVGGTQTYVVGLLEALAAGDEVHLRALVPPDMARATYDRLRAAPSTELLSYEQALARPEPSHVVHRPQQVFSADDLLLLRPLGTRLVITHHDLIAYHNPTYFPSIDLWQNFVRTTREALAVADCVAFFSHHALADALREDLTERSRCTVVHVGVRPNQQGEAPSVLDVPGEAPWLAETPFLLCIGADYQHKNRPFALALLDALRRRHGWPGVLVFAGPHVDYGSSKDEEQRARDRLEIPSRAVVELSAVSDGERSWLMRSAAAVVYPTVDEGFGLVPFEAASFGVPCLFAAQGSLSELLGTESATLVAWDPVRSADRVFPLLTDGEQRREHVQRLTESAQALRWDDCASATIDAYRQAVAAPFRASAEGAWQALEREQEIVRLDRHAEDLTSRLLQLSDELGPDALALVGPRALLSRAEQHALLGVAARPPLRRALFGGLRGAFRMMQAARRLSGRTAEPEIADDR